MSVADHFMIGACGLGFRGCARRMVGLVRTGNGRMVMRRNGGAGRFNHTNRTGRRHE